MAEGNKQQEKKAVQQRKIVCKGPRDKDSGAEVLRVQTGVKKDQKMDIHDGQTLVVNRDVSSGTAEKLLNMESWKFEEVK